MNLPKKIVIYSHYGHSVYFDGALAANYSPDGYSTSSWESLCRLLGIEFERRTVRWEDWPGQDKDPGNFHHPPKELAIVERHFAELDERRRVQRIASLREELAMLEGDGT